MVKASVEKLAKAIHLFEWILRRFFKKKTPKTKYRHFADEIHIEHTTHNLNCNCNKNECSEHSKHSQMTHVIFGCGQRSGESVEKGKNAIFFISKNNKLQMKPDLFMQTLPHGAMFVKNEELCARNLKSSYIEL